MAMLNNQRVIVSMKQVTIPQKSIKQQGTVHF